MNIVIAGAGAVGLHVARMLSRDGHDLTIIDSCPQAIERAEHAVDALTMRGPADCPRTLHEARVEGVDLFAALTPSGPINLVAGLLAKKAGARRTVARVRERHYFEDDGAGVYPGFMGLDLVVDEEALVARELGRLVRSRSASCVEPFADGHLEMVELQIDDEGPGVGTPVGELNLPDGVVIAGLLRRDQVLIPNASDAVHLGDDIVCVGPTSAIPATERLFARERRRFNQRTIIVGGGRVGGAVAQALDAEGTEVIIIEPRADRCDELSHLLDRAQVLLGDGTDMHLLKENGVERADVFCAVSNRDEVNLMAALLARDLGVPRCVTRVQNPDYVNVCRHLGLENSVSPRLLVAREIIRQLRSGAVVHEAEVLQGQAAVLEVQVLPDSRIAGRSLAELVIPRSALFCSHVRDGVARRPDPDAKLEPGDRLVIFVKSEGRSALEKLLRKPLAGGASA